MDKLTWYAENGQVYCRRGYEVALARLASYEATGLSPDEVTKMGMMFEDSKRYSGRLELKLDALSEKIPQWIPVTERLPRDRGNVLVVAFGMSGVVFIWAGVLQRERNGVSMLGLATGAMLLLPTGCPCRSRQ